MYVGDIRSGGKGARCGFSRIWRREDRGEIRTRADG